MEKYFLVTVVPKTCVWLPSIASGTVLSAHKHVPFDEKIYQYTPDKTTVQPISQFKKFTPSAQGYLLGYKDKFHKHILLFIDNLQFPETIWACDTCSIDITSQPAFLCISKFPYNGVHEGCGYSICTTCFYEGRLRRTIPIVEEELSLLVEGERWWGEEIQKPKITFEQNLLVRSVVTEYLKRRESVTPTTESSFPESDFNNYFKDDYPNMEDDNQEEDNWNVSVEEDVETEDEDSIVEEGAEEGLNQLPPPEKEEGEEKTDQLADDTEVILEETLQEPTTDPDYTLLIPDDQELS